MLMKFLKAQKCRVSPAHPFLQQGLDLGIKGLILRQLCQEHAGWIDHVVPIYLHHQFKVSKQVPLAKCFPQPRKPLSTSFPNLPQKF